MFEKILKMYVMAIAGDVRSPMPHIIGPPGCGKSTIVEELAAVVGVNLHIMNVSRMSPLEVEGVQMPQGEGVKQRLELLLATFWNQLKEGDIILMDEFLRGFPEVYNALLDIFTSRKVGKHVLPKVFIIAASNTNVAYDKALDDRLLHLPVDDPRTSKTTRKHLGQLVVDALGLHPKMVSSTEMEYLLVNEVCPMYDVLDSFKNKSSTPTLTKGSSLRKLIGQAQLREVQVSALKELINMNNIKALQDSKLQYVLYLDGKGVDVSYAERATKLLEESSDKLTEVQQRNILLNLQLIQMESARTTTKKGSNADDDDNPFV